MVVSINDGPVAWCTEAGREGSSYSNYALIWLTWIMHCNYTVLNKIFETCYPPSLFRKGLSVLVYMGFAPGYKTPAILAPVDTVDPDHILQGFGEHGWGRL
jgi:hypothetical protein